MKYAASLKGRLGWQGLRADEYTEDGPFLVTSEHFSNDRVDWSRCYHVSNDRYEIAPEIQLRADDLLMMKDGAAMGKLAYVDHLPGPACLNSHLLLFRPRNGRVANRFLYYVLASPGFKSFTERERTGTTFFGISQQSVEGFPLALPSSAEQNQIATFLDRETMKIDTLVAEQRRLVSLLEEKRHAIVSSAVTKGLDRSAPMKSSRIEWLGEVPARWNVAPIASRYWVQLGKMLDSTKITGDHLRPYLRVSDVQWGEINITDLPVMDFDENARHKFRLVPGDLLVNEGGSYPGRSAIWTGQIDECYYQKALHRLRAHRPENDSTRFLYFLMSWAANQGVFAAGGNETTIEHLPAEKLRRYRFAFPSIVEQLKIADFLETELKKIDALDVEALRTIALLQERRTALISAAVTGKIDVRHIANTEAA